MSLIDGKPEPSNIPELNMPQARINISDAADVVCDECGDSRFEPVYLIKRLSPLISPTGKEEVIPLGPPLVPPIFACYRCGHINESFLHPSLRAKVKESENLAKANKPAPKIQASKLTLLKKDE